MAQYSRVTDIGASPLSGPETPYKDPNDRTEYNPYEQAYSGISKEGFPARLLTARPVEKTLSQKVLTWLKVALFPIIAVTYITFCFVVHYRNVYIDVSNSKNIAVIKAGVTSLSIIIIFAGLIPLRSLFSELKSEEFFRVLSQRPQGVSLGDVNDIATPASGITDSIRIVVKGSGSSFLAWTLLGSIFVAAVSALAPAALSLEVVELEGEPMALKVAAIGPDTIFDTKTTDYIYTSYSDPVVNTAGTVGYVEAHLGLQFGYNETKLKGRYLVPKPVNLPLDANVRYISDVLELRPECEWLKMGEIFPFNPTGIQGVLFTNETRATNITKDVLIVGLQDIGSFNTSASFQMVNPAGRVFNGTTLYPATDGSIVWLFNVCKGDKYLCGRLGTVEPVYDLSGLPFIEYTPPPGPPPLNRTRLTYYSTILRCRSNEVIRTREISTFNGELMVGDKDLGIPQGNLHYWQSRFLLQEAMLPLSTILSAPMAPAPLYELGHPSVGVMILGRKVYDSVPSEGWHYGDPNSPDKFTMKPQPIEDITAYFATLMSSLVKIYLNGRLGETYVPARVTHLTTRFSSSLPHVIVSTILMLGLALFGIFAHFRKQAPQFTFVNVARSMADSDVPHKVVEEHDPSKDLANRVLSVSPRPMKDGQVTVPVFALQ